MAADATRVIVHALVPAELSEGVGVRCSSRALGGWGTIATLLERDDAIGLRELDKQPAYVMRGEFTILTERYVEWKLCLTVDIDEKDGALVYREEPGDAMWEGGPNRVSMCEGDMVVLSGTFMVTSRQAAGVNALRKHNRSLVQRGAEFFALSDSSLQWPPALRVQTPLRAEAFLMLVADVADAAGGGIGQALDLVEGYRGSVCDEKRPSRVLLGWYREALSRALARRDFAADSLNVWVAVCALFARTSPDDMTMDDEQWASARAWTTALFETADVQARLAAVITALRGHRAKRLLVCLLQALRCMPLQRTAALRRDCLLHLVPAAMACNRVAGLQLMRAVQDDRAVSVGECARLLADYRAFAPAALDAALEPVVRAVMKRGVGESPANTVAAACALYDAVAGHTDGCDLELLLVAVLREAAYSLSIGEIARGSMQPVVDSTRCFVRSRLAERCEIAVRDEVLGQLCETLASMACSNQAGGGPALVSLVTVVVDLMGGSDAWTPPQRALFDKVLCARVKSVWKSRWRTVVALGEEGLICCVNAVAHIERALPQLHQLVMHALHTAAVEHVKRGNPLARIAEHSMALLLRALSAVVDGPAKGSAENARSGSGTRSSTGGAPRMGDAHGGSRSSRSAGRAASSVRVLSLLPRSSAVPSLLDLPCTASQMQLHRFLNDSHVVLQKVLNTSLAGNEDLQRFAGRLLDHQRKVKELVAAVCGGRTCANDRELLDNVLARDMQERHLSASYVGERSFEDQIYRWQVVARRVAFDCDTLRAFVSTFQDAPVVTREIRDAVVSYVDYALSEALWVLEGAGLIAKGAHSEMKRRTPPVGVDECRWVVDVYASRLFQRQLWRPFLARHEDAAHVEQDAAHADQKLAVASAPVARDTDAADARGDSDSGEESDDLLADSDSDSEAGDDEAEMCTASALKSSASGDAETLGNIAAARLTRLLRDELAVEWEALARAISDGTVRFGELDEYFPAGEDVAGDLRALEREHLSGVRLSLAESIRMDFGNLRSLRQMAAPFFAAVAHFDIEDRRSLGDMVVFTAQLERDESWAEMTLGGAKDHIRKLYELFSTAAPSTAERLSSGSPRAEHKLVLQDAMRTMRFLASLVTPLDTALEPEAAMSEAEAVPDGDAGDQSAKYHSPLILWLREHDEASMTAMARVLSPPTHEALTQLQTLRARISPLLAQRFHHVKDLLASLSDSERAFAARHSRVNVHATDVAHLTQMLPLIARELQLDRLSLFERARRDAFGMRECILSVDAQTHVAEFAVRACAEDDALESGNSCVDDEAVVTVEEKFLSLEDVKQVYSALALRQGDEEETDAVCEDDLLLERRRARLAVLVRLIPCILRVWDLYQELLDIGHADYRLMCMKHCVAVEEDSVSQLEALLRSKVKTWRELLSGIEQQLPLLSCFPHEWLMRLAHMLSGTVQGAGGMHAQAAVLDSAVRVFTQYDVPIDADALLDEEFSLDSRVAEPETVHMWDVLRTLHRHMEDWRACSQERALRGVAEVEASADAFPPAFLDFADAMRQEMRGATSVVLAVPPTEQYAAALSVLVACNWTCTLLDPNALLACTRETDERTVRRFVRMWWQGATMSSTAVLLNADQLAPRCVKAVAEMVRSAATQAERGVVQHARARSLVLICQTSDGHHARHLEDLARQLGASAPVYLRCGDERRREVSSLLRLPSWSDVRVVTQRRVHESVTTRVRWYTSKDAGSGRSSAIQMWACEQSARYYRIPVLAPDAGDLLGVLRNIGSVFGVKGDARERVLLHLDVKYSVVAEHVAHCLLMVALRRSLYDEHKPSESPIWELGEHTLLAVEFAAPGGVAQYPLLSLVGKHFECESSAERFAFLRPVPRAAEMGDAISMWAAVSRAPSGDTAEPSNSSVWAHSTIPSLRFDARVDADAQLAALFLSLHQLMSAATAADRDAGHAKWHVVAGLAEQLGHAFTDSDGLRALVPSTEEAHRLLENLLSGDRSASPAPISFSSMAAASRFIALLFRHLVRMEIFWLAMFEGETAHANKMRASLVNQVADAARQIAQPQLKVEIGRGDSAHGCGAVIAWDAPGQTVNGEWGCSANLMVFGIGADLTFHGMYPVCRDAKLLRNDFGPTAVELLRAHGIDIVELAGQSDLLGGGTDATVFANTCRALLFLDGTDVNLKRIALADQPRITPEAFVEALLATGGGRSPHDRYVLTADNLFKMMLILYRVRCGLPVVLVSEAGVGKSSLCVYLFQVILGHAIVVQHVHSGTTLQQVWSAVASVCRIAEENGQARAVLFFDEFNTAGKNVLACITALMTDRQLGGVPLPDRVHIICAANPYRRRRAAAPGADGKHADTSAPAGLLLHHAPGGRAAQRRMRQQSEAEREQDARRHLVYQVNRVPLAVAPHVFNYGTMGADAERVYIYNMAERVLVGREPYKIGAVEWDGSHTAESVRKFASVVISAQKSARERSGDSGSAVSLRDVSRALEFYHWFRAHPAGRFLAGDADSRSAQYLSVYLTYAFRFSVHDRQQLLRDVFGEGNAAHATMKCAATAITEKLHGARDHSGVANGMVTGAAGGAVALNDALCENVFALFCCVANGVFALIVGKPGTSKSLSVDIIRAALSGDRGDALRREFGLPAVSFNFHQCSPLDTSKGFEHLYETAHRQSATDPSELIALVVLDELGLADLAPDRPIKVLHTELERSGVRWLGLCNVPAAGSAMSPDDAPVATIALSNWTVDQAQLSRGVVVLRADASEADLQRSAKEVSNALLTSLTDHHFSDIANPPDVRAAVLHWLQALVSVYRTMYDHSNHFVSMRDFFFAVKKFTAGSVDHVVRLMEPEAAGDVIAGGPRRISDFSKDYLSDIARTALIDSMVRNFSGSERMRELLRVQVDRLIRVERYYVPTPERLIGENIRDSSHQYAVHIARQVMVLSNSLIGLQLLESHVRRTIDPRVPWTVIFGPQFGQSSMMDVHVKLREVQHAVRRGGIIHLCHAERLIESLYQLLNQSYFAQGGTVYTEIALGNCTRAIPLPSDQFFRIIVHTSSERAHDMQLTSPAVLSRFEKHELRAQDFLDDTGRELLGRIEMDPLWRACASTSARRQLLPGYHDDLLPSFALDASSERERMADGEARTCGAESAESQRVDQDTPAVAPLSDEHGWLHSVDPVQLFRLLAGSAMDGQRCSALARARVYAQQYWNATATDAIVRLLRGGRSAAAQAPRLAIVVTRAMYEPLCVSTSAPFHAHVHRVAGFEHETELEAALAGAVRGDEGAKDCAEGGGTGDRVLVLQHEAGALRMDLLQYVKHTVAQRLAEPPVEGTNGDVACAATPLQACVIVVHLDGDSTDAEHWSFSYGDGWHYMWADELHADARVPSLSWLIAATLGDACAEEQSSLGDRRSDAPAANRTVLCHEAGGVPLDVLVSSADDRVFSDLLSYIIGPALFLCFSDVRPAPTQSFFHRLRLAVRLPGVAPLLRQALVHQLAAARSPLPDWGILAAVTHREFNRNGTLARGLRTLLAHILTPAVAHLCVESDLSLVISDELARLWCRLVPRIFAQAGDRDGGYSDDNDGHGARAGSSGAATPFLLSVEVRRPVSRWPPGFRTEAPPFARLFASSSAGGGRIGRINPLEKEWRTPFRLEIFAAYEQADRALRMCFVRQLLAYTLPKHLADVVLDPALFPLEAQDGGGSALLDTFFTQQGEFRRDLALEHVRITAALLMLHLMARECPAAVRAAIASSPPHRFALLHEWAQRTLSALTQHLFEAAVPQRNASRVLVPFFAIAAVEADPLLERCVSPDRELGSKWLCTKLSHRIMLLLSSLLLRPKILDKVARDPDGELARDLREGVRALAEAEYASAAVLAQSEQLLLHVRDSFRVRVVAQLGAGSKTAKKLWPSLVTAVRSQHSGAITATALQAFEGYALIRCSAPDCEDDVVTVVSARDSGAPTEADLAMKCRKCSVSFKRLWDEYLAEMQRYGREQEEYERARAAAAARGPQEEAPDASVGGGATEDVGEGGETSGPGGDLRGGVATPQDMPNPPTAPSAPTPERCHVIGSFDVSVVSALCADYRLFMRCVEQILVLMADQGARYGGAIEELLQELLLSLCKDTFDESISHSFLAAVIRTLMRRDASNALGTTEATAIRSPLQSARAVPILNQVLGSGGATGAHHPNQDELCLALCVLHAQRSAADPLDRLTADVFEECFRAAVEQPTVASVCAVQEAREWLRDAECKAVALLIVTMLDAGEALSEQQLSDRVVFALRHATAHGADFERVLGIFGVRALKAHPFVRAHPVIGRFVDSMVPYVLSTPAQYRSRLIIEPQGGTAAGLDDELMVLADEPDTAPSVGDAVSVVDVVRRFGVKHAPLAEVLCGADADDPALTRQSSLLGVFLLRFAHHSRDVFSTSATLVPVFCALWENAAAWCGLFLPGGHAHQLADMFHSSNEQRRFVMCQCGNICLVGDCGNVTLGTMCLRCNRCLARAYAHLAPHCRQCTADDFADPPGWYVPCDGVVPLGFVRGDLEGEVRPLEWRVMQLTVVASIMGGLCASDDPDAHATAVMRTMLDHIATAHTANEQAPGRSAAKELLAILLTQARRHLHAISRLVDGASSSAEAGVWVVRNELDAMAYCHCLLNALAAGAQALEVPAPALHEGAAAFASRAGRAEFERTFARLLQAAAGVANRRADDAAGPSERAQQSPRAALVAMLCPSTIAPLSWMQRPLRMGGVAQLEQLFARDPALAQRCSFVNLFIDPIVAPTLDALVHLEGALHFAVLARTALVHSMTQLEAESSLTVRDGIVRIAAWLPQDGELIGRRLVADADDVWDLYREFERLWNAFARLGSVCNRPTFLDQFACHRGLADAAAGLQCLSVDSPLAAVCCGSNEQSICYFATQLLSSAVEATGQVAERLRACSGVAQSAAGGVDEKCSDLDSADYPQGEDANGDEDDGTVVRLCCSCSAELGAVAWRRVPCAARQPFEHYVRDHCVDSAEAAELAEAHARALLFGVCASTSRHSGRNLVARAFYFAPPGAFPFQGVEARNADARSMVRTAADTGSLGRMCRIFQNPPQEWDVPMCGSQAAAVVERLRDLRLEHTALLTLTAALTYLVGQCEHRVDVLNRARLRPIADVLRAFLETGTFTAEHVPNALLEVLGGGHVVRGSGSELVGGERSVRVKVMHCFDLCLRLWRSSHVSERLVDTQYDQPLSQRQAQALTECARACLAMERDVSRDGLYTAVSEALLEMADNLCLYRADASDIPAALQPLHPLVLALEYQDPDVGEALREASALPANEALMLAHFVHTARLWRNAKDDDA